MSKRSGKFYYKNEKETLKSLGLEQVPGSGNGWIHKEDGENDYLLAQLKSTDASSISIKQLDLDKLEYHANTSRKTPLFVIQFLKTNDIYILSRPMDIPTIAEYIKTGVCQTPDTVVFEDKPVSQPTRIIKSSGKSKENFWKQKQKEWEKCQRRKK